MISNKWSDFLVLIGNFGVVGDQTSWQLAPEEIFYFVP